MNIISKFRTLFLIRKSIVFVFFSIIWLSVFFQGIHETESQAVSTAIIMFVISAIFQIINLKSVYKIMISNEGITKAYIISRQSEFIPFSNIKNTQLNHVRGTWTDAGQITEGYYESVIILKNNKILLITPDYFENYKELIKVLSYNFTEFKQDFS